MSSLYRKSSFPSFKNLQTLVLFSSMFSLFYLLCSVSTLAIADSIPGMAVEDTDARRSELFSDILRDEAVYRIDQLGKISDADGYLERTFMSPASIRASNLILSWMQDAGLRTWVDQMGNLRGRIEATNASAEALLIGSHLVIAFSDEEGVRFQSTFLGSAAIAGILPVSALQITDKSGVSVQDALKINSFEVTEESFLQLNYDARSVWGYIEVHIEQGPVLESLGHPLGVVEGIAGQTRLRVTVRGSQGHAGTVPMSMRRDPMPAAAELIILLENLCKHPENFITYDEQCKGLTEESLAGSIVCTVGEISSWPSASNVIPGQVTFTVDLRAIDDMAREAIIFELSSRMHQICDRRSVYCIIERKHNAEAVYCDPGLSLQLKFAAHSALKRMESEIQGDVPMLMSGAGHDAMAMSHLTKVGMLFVRCRGGISHSPAEHVLDDDVWAAGLALLAFMETNM
ncbi:allantoate amidohydrolase isoform X3 [Tasmannia lanceolata]|uniref:allantoate amidohydrolase isoform X3 n=1 Tax=Tasmannia lanceolata TaxID=3420 RepID=UPI004062BAC3